MMPYKYITYLGEWDSSLNELQRMLIVRSLRPDRVSFCATKFIVNNLGSKFVEPPVLDMKQVLDDSTCKIPLIFVLSPGVVSGKLINKTVYRTLELQYKKYKRLGSNTIFDSIV